MKNIVHLWNSEIERGRTKHIAEDPSEFLSSISSLDRGGGIIFISNLNLVGLNTKKVLYVGNSNGDLALQEEVF